MKTMTIFLGENMVLHYDANKRQIVLPGSVDPIRKVYSAAVTLTSDEYIHVVLPEGAGELRLYGDGRLALLKTVNTTLVEKFTAPLLELK